MGSEIHGRQAEDTTNTAHAPEPGDGIRWVLLGPQGLRTGWSVALFLFSFLLLMDWFNQAGGFVLEHLLHWQMDTKDGMSPQITLFGESLMFAALVASAWLLARVERRRVLDYNLTGPRRAIRFASGVVTGFAMLSALVGAMAAGGWIHLGPVTLNPAQIALYAALWAVAFLLVGLMEEGFCRCVLQFTLTRGISFWWALGVVAFLCATLLPSKGQSTWGVYFFAALGLLPCLWLHLRNAPGNSFWQAAWTTSTFFGYVHISNHGENWIGIFAAAAIGFVFCVSIRVTGSAWWAIGFHAAWDWAETFFYGTADSGLQPKGHLLAATPAGPALWNGGTDGPEGSLLVLPVILLAMAAVLAQYRRGWRIVEAD